MFVKWISLILSIDKLHEVVYTCGKQRCLTKEGVIMTLKVSEQELQEKGYLYLGDYGVSRSKLYRANQIWLNYSDGDLIIYDPDDEKILRSIQKEPRYQNQQRTAL